MIHPGSVVLNESGPHVVIYMENHQIKEMVPLDAYIRKTVYIEFEGALRTIEEVIQINCNDYLARGGN